MRASAQKKEIPDLKMLAEDQQLRVGSADGSPYPSFLEISGPDDGQRHWATAGQQPACTGLDPHFDDLPMLTALDALGSGHDEDGSESERECHGMVIPPCVNQQMPVEGSSPDGSSMPQKPVATSSVDADSTPTSNIVDGSSSRPDINPAPQPSWVKLSLEDALKHMLPDRWPTDIDTIQVGILTAPGWVPPSDMTSYDHDRLLDLAGFRISDSDREYITCVTIKELTDGQKNKRKREAKLTQEISHSVIIQVKAENKIRTKKVVKNIVSAWYEKVFKYFEFEFKKGTGATPRWNVRTKACMGHGESDENRMRDTLKKAIAFEKNPSTNTMTKQNLPFFIDSKVLTPEICESLLKKQKTDPPPLASTEGLLGASGGGRSIGLGGGHFVQEQGGGHFVQEQSVRGGILRVSTSSPLPPPLPTSTNSAGSRQDTPSTPSDTASTVCLPPHLELVKNQLLDNFLKILERWPLDAVCLRFFLYTESAHFRQKESFEIVTAYLAVWEDFGSDSKEVRETIFEEIERLLPHPLRPEIDTVNQVLNFIVKDILKIDGTNRRKFEKSMTEMLKENAARPSESFSNWFNMILKKELNLGSIVARCSMGIFFRMPSWLAILVMSILEHSTSVQEELYAAGYRRFAELNLTADATLDGDTTAAVSFSTFCGYNIQECPEFVGDSISFSGRVSEQHLHLTKMLSLLEREPLVREYYAQATGVQKEEEEEEYVEEEEEEETALQKKQRFDNFCGTRRVVAYLQRMCVRKKILSLFRATHKLQTAVRRTQQRASYLQELDAARRVMACMQRMCIREKFLTLFRATHKLQMVVRRTQQRASYLLELDAARRVMACMQRMCIRENFLTLFRATHKLQMVIRRTQQRASYLLDTARIEQTLEATLTLEPLIRTLEATLAIQPLIRPVQPHRRYFGRMLNVLIVSKLHRLWHRNEFLILYRAMHELQKAVRRTQLRARYLQDIDAYRRNLAQKKEAAAHQVQKAVRPTQHRARYLQKLEEAAAASVQASIRRAIMKNQILRDHAAATRMQRFWIWHHCRPKELREDQEIEENKVYIMYHGTDKVENAALIEQQGLRASRNGLLGPGVYVSRDIRKAERYYRGSGAIFEVLVRTGRVCHINDHLVAVHDLEGNVVREVSARDLVPDQWHEAGYDTVWVPDCSKFVFRGGAGWDVGIREETCVFEATRITVLRRMVWETNRADVNGVQWSFEEVRDRAGAHAEAHGSWVPYSRRLSIMIESHHLAYESNGGEARFVTTIESERKHFHHHTGLQYEIDLVRCTQRNVMTGYLRRLLRRDLAQEAAASRVQASIRRAITKNQMLRDHAAATRMQRFWIWHHCRPNEISSNDVSCAVIPVQFQTTAAVVLTTREGSMEDDAANMTWTEETPEIDEPEWLCCPITNLMFRDPVMVPESGTTYELSTLEKWWKGKNPKDLFSNEELWSMKVITNMDKRREVDSWLQKNPGYVPYGWESRDIPPPPKPPRYVTQETQAGAASSHADRDEVSPHAGQDVQTWWGEKPDPKKEFDRSVKMQERPHNIHHMVQILTDKLAETVSPVPPERGNGYDDILHRALAMSMISDDDNLMEDEAMDVDVLQQLHIMGFSYEDIERVYLEEKEQLKRSHHNIHRMVQILPDKLAETASPVPPERGGAAPPPAASGAGVAPEANDDDDDTLQRVLAMSMLDEGDNKLMKAIAMSMAAEQPHSTPPAASKHKDTTVASVGNSEAGGSSASPAEHRSGNPSETSPGNGNCTICREERCRNQAKCHLHERLIDAVTSSAEKTKIVEICEEAGRHGFRNLVNEPCKRDVPEGRTALAYAVQMNLERVTRDLIELGASVHQQMGTNATVLTLVATNEKRDGTEMVRLLLSKRADPSELEQAGIDIKKLNIAMQYWLQISKKSPKLMDEDLQHLSNAPPMHRMHELAYAIVGERLSLTMFKSALTGWFSQPRGFTNSRLKRDPLVMLLLGCPGIYIYIDR